MKKPFYVTVRKKKDSVNVSMRLDKNIWEDLKVYAGKGDSPTLLPQSAY